MSSFNDWLHRNYPNTVDYKIAHHINDDMEEAYNAGMERAAEILLAIGYCEDDAELNHIREEIT